MEHTEQNHIWPDQGCLVVERRPEGVRVLFADETARNMMKLSGRDLSLVQPEQAVKDMPVSVRRLDGEHELWVLGDPDGHMEAICQMNAELERALQEAKEANQAKSRFLSNMSHDIRTPMNAIVGMTAISLSHIDEKARVLDCLNKIKTASTHLMGLVNDVLDMSRIDSGRMTLNEEEFSLADLVHDIAVIVRPQANQKKQVLRIGIGEILEENLVGDPLRLRQILVNIISNAVKYTQDGGEIQVNFAQRIAPEANGAVWLDFSCRDNGMGMSEKFLERIFEPFERASNTTMSKIEGTGLGMAIVKRIVDSMGGSVRVQSKEGSGSLFEVALPIPVSKQGEKDPKLPAGGVVLVADSRENQAMQIMNYLRQAGLEPVHLSTGSDVVTWLTEAQYENRMPCALLLGQELTDMAVLNVAAHVRQLAGRELPILLVSEEDWARMEYRAVRAGVSAFVPCPLFRSRLIGTLAALIGSAEQSGVGGREDVDYSGHRVLLVEDNELNQEIATELLGMIGVQIETANDGKEAVEKFSASQEGYYDIVFMDIQMPVMNGYEATRQIRALPRGDARSVWIVAMTANAFVEDVRMSQEAGMNDHVSKPVDPDRLTEILRERLAP